MKILFVTPVPPLLTKPRPYFFIKNLADAGHEVSLAMQVRSEEEWAALADAPGWSDLQPHLKSVHRTVVPLTESVVRCAASLPTGSPLRVAYCRSKPFQSMVMSVVERERIDLLHVDRERLAPLFADATVPSVLDATDCLTSYLKAVLHKGSALDRLVSAFELLKMPGFERTMGSGYQACLVTTNGDAGDLRRIGVEGPLEVVPNGVDDRYLSAAPQPEPGRVTFVGNMGYAPNVEGMRWFTKEVWPLVRQRSRQSRLAIVGLDPVASIKRLHSPPEITVTGTVDDVLPWLQATEVFVSPLRIGGGFPNKLAEAMALGVPAVATSAAAAGIPEARHNHHLLLADSPADFAGCVGRLLEDSGLRSTLSDNARRLMRANYRWPDVVGRLMDVYTRAAVRGPAN